MGDKFDIDILQEEFSEYNVISLKDIDGFYRDKEPSIPKTTVSWRIHSLIQKGVLQRVGHGKYKLGETQHFSPDVTYKMKQIAQIIKRKFPFIKYCQWELSSVNLFSQHLINFNIHFVDVERDVVEAVYYGLKEHYSKVMLIQNIYDDLSEFADTIIVRPLVTDSPINKKENTSFATLEKILVDLYTDKEFISFQENEIYHIFQNAFDKYTINKQTMLRYAGRKNKRDKIEEILKS